MGTVGGIRTACATGTQVRQVVEPQQQQQQQQPNTLPLEVWLVNILPLTPLRDLLPLCSTSKWLGDELKHDVVIKAALARRGHGKKFMSASSFVGCAHAYCYIPCVVDLLVHVFRCVNRREVTNVSSFPWYVYALSPQPPSPSPLQCHSLLGTRSQCQVPCVSSASLSAKSVRSWASAREFSPRR